MNTATTMMPASPFETTTTAGGGDFEHCKKGNLAAVIFGLIDLGTHTIHYAEKDGKPARDVDTRKGMLLIQISKKLRCRRDGLPFVFGLGFSKGASPNARMRQIYETILGVKLSDSVRFDPSELIGRSCAANIIDAKTAKGKEYTRLETVADLTEGMADVPVDIVGLPHMSTEHTDGNGNVISPSKPALIWYIGMDDPFPSYDWMPWDFHNNKIGPLYDIFKDSHEYRKAHGITESTITTPNFVEAKVILEGTMVASGHELWSLLSRIDRECRTKLVDEAVSFCEAMQWPSRLSDLNEADANTVYGNVRRTLLGQAGPSTEELQEVF